MKNLQQKVSKIILISEYWVRVGYPKIRCLGTRIISVDDDSTPDDVNEINSEPAQSE